MHGGARGVSSVPTCILCCFKVNVEMHVRAGGCVNERRGDEVSLSQLGA